MKHFVIGAILSAISLPAASSTGIGTITLKSDEELCEKAPPLEPAALLETHRNDGTITLVVTSEMNCAYVPDKPKLFVWRNAATVALPTRSPSGFAVMCLCQHRMTFEIMDLYEGAETFYYVQDGKALGHIAVP
jgi:hypothetical protein